VFSARFFRLSLLRSVAIQCLPPRERSTTSSEWPARSEAATGSAFTRSSRSLSSTFSRRTRTFSGSGSIATAVAKP
jgi:hypothetical protein